MPKYNVRGTYIMTFFVDVDREVEANDEEEALEQVQDEMSAGEAYESNCEWAFAGPDMTLVEE